VDRQLLLAARWGTLVCRDATPARTEGGENISSIEVEQTICAHPAVLECAVIGIPHERWGERPKAFVTLNSEPALPKTSTGKVQKFALREREWTGRETRAGTTQPPDKRSGNTGSV
jgi:acyl-CoA synthetase (AMP-forming)/AMP-acid ligase II